MLLGRRSILDYCDPVAVRGLFWSLMDVVTVASHVPNTNVRLNISFENQPFRTLRNHFADLHQKCQPPSDGEAKLKFAAIQDNLIELESRYRSCEVLWEDVPLSSLMSMLSSQSLFCLQLFGKWDSKADGNCKKQHHCGHRLNLTDNGSGIYPIDRNADWYEVHFDSLRENVRSSVTDEKSPYSMTFHTRASSDTSDTKTVLSTHIFQFVYSKAENDFVMDPKAYREIRSIYIDMSKTNGITENVMLALMLELDLRLGRGDNKHRTMLTSSELTQLLCLIDYLGLNNTERLTECGIIKF